MLRVSKRVSFVSNCLETRTLSLSISSKAASLAASKLERFTGEISFFFIKTLI